MTRQQLKAARARGGWEALFADYLAAVANSDVVVLASSPEACVLRRVNDMANGFDLRRMFELRAFCATAEFRWRRRGSADGIAAILGAIPAPTDGRWSAAAIDFIDTLPRSYLLWGEACPGTQVTLAAAQIGELVVPTPSGPPQTHVRLEAIEYIDSDPVHGNAQVVAERLVRLAWYAPEPAGHVRVDED